MNKIHTNKTPFTSYYTIFHSNKCLQTNHTKPPTSTNTDAVLSGPPWYKHQPDNALHVHSFVIVKHHNLIIVCIKLKEFKFSGVFAILWNVTYLCHVCLSFCPSAWNNSAATGRIFMKFDIWVFFKTVLRKFKFHYNLTRMVGTQC